MGARSSSAGLVEPQAQLSSRGFFACLDANAFGSGDQSVRCAAQLELTDADGDVETGLGLDAERLQGESVAGAANQEIGAGADRSGHFGAGADIVAGERAR